MRTRVYAGMCVQLCACEHMCQDAYVRRARDRAGGKSRDETATSARAAATPTPFHENSQIEAVPRQTGEVRHWPRCHRQHCSRCHFHRRPRRMTWGTNNAAATLTVMQAICKDEHRHTPLKAEGDTVLTPRRGNLAGARLPHVRPSGCGTGLAAVMNAAVAGISVVALG